LRRWVKDADIQPLVKGSDHCPVFLDLHDTIVDEEGRELNLSDAMQSPTAASLDSREPPRICAKNWDEYSAKQTLLSTFFTPRTALASTSSESQISPMLTTPPTPTELQHSSGSSLPQPPVESGPAAEEAEPSSVTQSSQKRKRPIDDCGQVKKAKVDKPKNGQSKLSSFFQKPKPAPGKGKESPIDVHDDEKSVEDSQYDRDIETAIMLSQTESSASASISKAPRVGNKEAWSSLLAPLQVPNCTVHGEPSKLYTVNKPGPSKGKTFFLCSR
jgi:AP endonuclease-2